MLSYGAFTSLQYPAPAVVIEPITTNMIAWYDAANASSYPGTGTTVTNISPNSPNVDLTLGGTYTYNSSGVKYFDWGGSSTSHGNAGAAPTEIHYQTNNALGSDFTFEVGFEYVTGAPSLFNVRDAGIFGGLSRPGYFFSSDRFSLQGVATYFYTSATTSQFSAGNWYQIVIAVSGTSMKVYVNGVNTETITISSTRPQIDSPEYGAMGAYASGGGVTGGVNFKQQYLRIYNDIQLSDEQVLQNYNSKISDLGL